MSQDQSGINTRPPPALRAVTGTSNLFLKEQVQKQQHNNFHSSSLNKAVTTMVSQNVNKTALHPTGVQYVEELLLPLIYIDLV